MVGLGLGGFERGYIGFLLRAKGPNMGVSEN